MGWPLWNPAIGWWLLIAAGVALNFVIMGLIAAGVAHWVVIIVTMGLIAAGVALWVVISCVAKRFRDAWPRERLDNGNGIRVGAPKVYDNRSLAVMIEQ